MQGEETFDFVVIGAGSSGCVLANRLSEDGKSRVALVEAGPKDSNPWIHVPIGYGKTMWNDRLNWRFHTEPEPTMGGRRIYWPRGRVLGGCSSINGLIVVRGQKEDYDGWAQNGADGWSYDDVLPYFVKLEDNARFAGDPLHGTGGPVTISSIPRKHELIEVIKASAKKLGVPETEDFNGAAQEGVGYYQLTTRNGLRVSAAKAYLSPAAGRPNLSILTETRARRVVFENGRAVGIEVSVDGEVKLLKARHGVILSAGAVQSPHLLMLSGIGPAEHLRANGIGVYIDSPGVGGNLQDHLQLRLLYRCSKPITTNDALNSLIGRLRMGLEYALFRGGPLAIGINQGGLFTRVLPESKTPDIQFHIGTLSADMAGGKVHDYSGFTLSVCQLRPESTGEIRLGSADPLDAPRITANYLATETDRRCAVEGMKFARRLAATAPFSDYVAEEKLPGPGITDDEGLLGFAREYGATIFHPVGTCRIGREDDREAVVDPRLRVRGVDGLWVVDCSVMPRLVSGNTNIPAIMIGEKAADMIREDTLNNSIGRDNAQNSINDGRTQWLGKRELQIVN
ncbi:GMC family oxidoreductase [Xanthobacter tagetidis]|jgi:choline dehydrogenase|uniref:Choline dehydrogenase n=1 Tax=Xanthobacter tagetidis TaxID=60216 RepID=A0A3L7AKS9_9HYPH|nr:GMC family oxidoreductase N-terminal domain-containing protein [Xanthobacter tagetidis]MBB6306956.1 choline dehydrogenase [Xanthobacter tagetidis]RLP79982.1 choline dehydrogenase [Xanthobacter tagetidis]